MGPKPLHSDFHGVLGILSVDDDSVNLMVIEQLLRPEGWKVGTGPASSDLPPRESSPSFVLLRCPDYLSH